MQRRQFQWGLCACVLASTSGLRAQGLAGLSAADALGGIRAALSGGAEVAVQTLGRSGGFASHPQWRIGLPGFLADAEPLLRGLGQGKRLDELVAAMNQAAEKAVPLAAGLLKQSIQRLTVDDAQRIVRGGDTGVTDFFARQTREPLTAQFLPVVKQTTAEVRLAEQYDQLAKRAAKMGLLKNTQADLASHVTDKALDGLYALIAEEERKLR